MKTYEFKLYNNERFKCLEEHLDIACHIYNHCIALLKRYYRLYGKYISANKMKAHIKKLKRRFPRWKKLNSQAVQDIVERIDRAYQSFFKLNGRRPPHFRKRSDYRSFTLKQTGYRLDGDVITIMGKKYKFFKSREVIGSIKIITVKKKPTGDWYIYVVTDHEEVKNLPRTGKAVGIDFGLKDFLVTSDGEKIQSPEYTKQLLAKLRRLSRNYSLKEKNSHNKEKAYLELMRLYEKTANMRKDFFFKLARDILSRYDFVAIEDLNLDGMKRLWGRKVSDLAYGEFVSILEHVAHASDKTVVKIDRYAPSTKICSKCGSYHPLSLKDREWTCPDCGAHHDRDINAAINIRNIAFS